MAVKDILKKHSGQHDGLRAAYVLAVLLPAVAVDYAAVGLMRTLLPFLVRRYSSSALLIGALESAYGVGQVCGGLFLGRLSDTRGRRWVLLLSLGGSALGYSLAGLAPSVWVLLLSRLPVGLSKQTLTVSRAAVADVTSGPVRSALMCWIMAASGAGYAVGPLAGARLATRLGESAAALTAAGLFVILMVVVALFLPETCPESKPIARWSFRGRIKALHQLDGGLFRAFAVMMLPEMAIIMFSTTVLSSIAVRDFGESKLWLGSVNAAMSCGASLVSAVVLPVLSLRLGDWQVLRIGYLAYGIASALLAVVLTRDAIWVSVLPFSFGVSVLRSTPAAFVSRRLPPDVQGEALGMLDALSSLCRVICPILCGMAIDRFGSQAPLCMQAVLCLCGAVLLHFVDPMPADV